MRPDQLLPLQPAAWPAAATVDRLREFSLLPFWFWNDELDEGELLRQIDDFERHGVHGFVIHPRVGLPRSLGWMSERLLHFYDVAIEEAARRRMRVVLYDEAMYPSGSSCGQVVAENPAFGCRGLSCLEWAEGAEPEVPPGWNAIATFPRAGGRWMGVYDRPVASFIRGLHFTEPDPPRNPGPDSDNPGSPRRDPPEDHPPAADLLNPESVACFIRKVYGRFHERFGRHFGKTIPAIFTDEPSLLGRGAAAGIQPGTTDILAHVNRILGYDFTPHLPALWDKDDPGSARYRDEYRRAVQVRLEETYYRQLHDWCEAHGVALAGHPDNDDKIGLMRYFQMPGNDLVWRYVEPGKANALEGEHATMAKCTSSAMLHLGRRRNGNEFCGAYGRRLTFDEMKWLANWCFVRGVNLLFPHAFYYSMRGPRQDERPPDVGPNSPWWDAGFTAFAGECARLCWLNTDAEHVCDIAILGWPDHLPWRAAKVCHQHQRDFNYLDLDHLADGTATADADGIRIAGLHYKALIVEPGRPIPPAAAAAVARLDAAGRCVEFTDGPALLARLEELAPSWLRVEPALPDLRCRRVLKDGCDRVMLFNEGVVPLSGRIDLGSGGRGLALAPGELIVVARA